MTIIKYINITNMLCNNFCVSCNSARYFVIRSHSFFISLLLVLFYLYFNFNKNHGY